MNQIKKYNGIECLIEDFIEQAHQFGMIDERRIANMSDRVKTSTNHFRVEIISIDGEVK